MKIALVRLRIPGSTVAGVGASNGVVLLFDTVVGASLLTTAWALGLVPALPRPSPLAVGRSGRRARARRDHRRRRPSAPREPSPGRFDPGEPRVSTCAASFRTRPERGRADSGSPSPCWLHSAFRPRVPIAGLVVVASGMSTLVPATPGGAGTQQLLIVVALQQVASAASALSFSIGMQVGVTLVNTIVGVRRDHARLRDDAARGDPRRASPLAPACVVRHGGLRARP